MFEATECLFLRKISNHQMPTNMLSKFSKLRIDIVEKLDPLRSIHQAKQRRIKSICKPKSFEFQQTLRKDRNPNQRELLAGEIITYVERTCHQDGRRNTET